MKSTILYADDNRLLTNVGRRVGQHIVSTGCEGHLIYGPYISFGIGRYRIVVHGKLTIDDKSNAYVDICAQHGHYIFASAALTSTSVDGHLASLEIIITRYCMDLEVRVFVDAQTKISISAIQIQTLCLRHTQRIFDNGDDSSIHRTVGELISIGSDKLAITFQPMEWLGFGIQGFAEDFLISKGFDVLCFKPLTNNWYQDVSISEVESQITNLEPYRFRLGYGSSMGGYGLLYFAQALRLDKVIIFSPQYSINNSSVNFDTGYSLFEKDISFSHEPITRHSNLDVVIAYDPYADADKLHVDSIRQCFPKGQNLALAYSGHPTQAALHEACVLKQFFDMASSEKRMDISVFKQALREKSSEYSQRLLRHIMKKRCKSALRVLNLLAAYRPKDPSWLLKQGLETGNDLVLHGDIKQAVFLGQQLIQKLPRQEHGILFSEMQAWHFGICRLYTNDNRFITHVGQYEGTYLKSTGSSGHLLFGPYIDLGIGLYAILIRGSLDISRASGRAYADIAIKKGSKILAQTHLVGHESRDCLALLLVEIDEPCHDLEIRIWVDSHDQITISMIEIHANPGYMLTRDY